MDGHIQGDDKYLVLRIIISMEALNTFLNLVSKTEGRDKVLRLFQYSCLHAVDHQQKGGRFRVYEQMRITRKMLRFLRTLDYSAKVKSQLPQLKKSINSLPSFIRHLTNILHNIFGFLYFIADHRVCLSELNVISGQHHAEQTRRSLQFYAMKNIFAILNNITCMVISVLNNRDSKDIKKLSRAIKHYAFDLIRCVLDCLVALYHWRRVFSPKTAGIIGVVSTVMSIIQSLDKM